MRVAQKCAAFWVNDMHQNKGLSAILPAAPVLATGAALTDAVVCDTNRRPRNHLWNIA